MKEIAMREQTTNIDILLRRLLDRPTFHWRSTGGASIEQMIVNSSQTEAQEQLVLLQANSQLAPLNIIDKVSPRASSWNFQELLEPYRNQGFGSLDEFLAYLTQQGGQIKALIAQYKPGEDVDKNLINTDWIISTLSYEARAAIKRKSQALLQEREKIKQEVLAARVKELRTTPDARYGDTYNKMVCLKLDALEASGEIAEQSNKLGYADKIVRQEMLESLGNQQIKEYLQQKLEDQKKKKLTNYLKRGVELLNDPEKALNYAALMFELSQRKTDETWQAKKLEEIVAAALRGDQINFISMLCCINQFDYNGGYTLVPDLFAYQSNPKLEPVPLIIDEMVGIIELFKFYGADSRLTMYVADTDYTEIGQYGTVTEGNLNNLNQYLKNLADYLARYEGVQVAPISDLTSGSQVYQEVKSRVLENVQSFKDPDFSREWYPKFEQAFEKVYESQVKKGLFSNEEVLKKSQTIIKNIWAVNAAQGAIFGSLGSNTVLLSTERRERDQNYVIDKGSRSSFPPVLYVLNVAEIWNRKLKFSNG